MNDFVTDRQELPFVTVDSTILDALVAIDQCAMGIAVVVNSLSERKIRGVVTDGDIRRALIRQVSLDAFVKDVMVSTPLIASPGTPREIVLAKLEAHGLSAVPIVDSEEVVVGIHGIRELIDSTVPNWALIMAGGRGTRLAPLTHTIPKPLVPVAGRPIIERLLLHLVDSGLRKFVISIAYLGEQIVDFLGDGSRYGCEIHYLKEDVDKPLGTAGALAQVSVSYPQAVERTIVLLNGDIVTQVNIRHLLERHEKYKADATLVLRPYEHEVPFGLVELGEGGAVTGLVEKPTWRGSLNAGVYALSPSIQQVLNPGEKVDAPEVIQRALDKGLTVRAEEVVSTWQDVGTWDELRKARGSND